MNVLPREKQIQAISALTEGCSIRATERLTGAHRDTIMRLGVRVGEGCATLHDRMMQGLQVPILEFDEIWGYVGKKQRRTVKGETDAGDQYTFIALDATHKAIISHKTGKRNEATTREFVNDVWERVVNRPQITTDGFGPYIEAVAECFGDGADFAQLVKHYAAVALYVAHYNLCRVHETTRITPAMGLGVTDHIWDIGELIEATTGQQPEGRPSGRFRVIDGGLFDG